MQIRSHFKRWRLFSALVALTLIVGACAPAAPPATITPTRPPIKLAENPWTGSSANVYVAKQLIEEKLGYKVEIVPIEEKNQWAALANGDLSASLEIWPSGHAENIKQYITEQKVVDDLGPLGVVGKIGWYVPTYVVDEIPEMATWEGLKKAENLALFKTPETGDKGQFLQGDPSWVYYDANIIQNLGLDLQVISAGSEQAELAAVASAINRHEPILFYFWTPHSIHARFRLTEVKLPPHTETCYANAPVSVDCAYPEDVLIKAASIRLKSEAPVVYTFLQKMNYSNEDQISLIAAIELDKKTPQEAAQEWIEKNEAQWKNWLP